MAAGRLLESLIDAGGTWPDWKASSVDCSARPAAQPAGKEGGAAAIPHSGKLVEQFEASGLGDKIQSWIGGGANAPVSGAEVKEALGQDQVQSMAQEVGLDTDQAADEIAQKLPKRSTRPRRKDRCRTSRPERGRIQNQPGRGGDWVTAPYRPGL